MRHLIALIVFLACAAAAVEHRALHLGTTATVAFAIGAVIAFGAVLDEL